MRTSDQIVGRGGIPRQRNRFPQHCFRLCIPLGVGVDLAEIDQRIGILLVQVRCSQQLDFRGLGIMLLHGDVAQQIVAAGVVGTGLQLRLEFGGSLRKGGVPVAIHVRQRNQEMGMRRATVLHQRLLELQDGVVQRLPASFFVGKAEHHVHPRRIPEARSQIVKHEPCAAEITQLDVRDSEQISGVKARRGGYRLLQTFTGALVVLLRK